MDRLSERILRKVRHGTGAGERGRGRSHTGRQPLSSPSRERLAEAVRRRVQAHRRQRANVLLAIFLPLGILVTALLVWLFWPLYTATGVSTSRAGILAGTLGPLRPLTSYFHGEDSIHVLFTGLDKDPPHRSDTVMVGHLDLRTLQMRVLSVPRDLRVELPDGSRDKLAHAYVYGHQREGDGSQWVRESVARELGIDIPYFVTINFDGFVELVDALGGVDLEVEKALKYRDRAQDLVIDIPAGPQHMDGETLLKYVRFRHDATGDIGRMERQQKAIHAVLAALKERGMWRSAVAMLPATRDAFETNLTLDQLTALARQVPRIKDSFIRTMTLPSESTMFDGVSYQVTTSEWLAEGVGFLEDLSPRAEAPRGTEEPDQPPNTAEAREDT